MKELIELLMELEKINLNTNKWYVRDNFLVYEKSENNYSGFVDTLWFNRLNLEEKPTKKPTEKEIKGLLSLEATKRLYKDVVLSNDEDIPVDRRVTYNDDFSVLKIEEKVIFENGSWKITPSLFLKHSVYSLNTSNVYEICNLNNNVVTLTNGKKYTFEELKREFALQDIEDDDDVISDIENWATERNFFGEGGATIQSQFVKLIEEAGELAGNIARGKDCTDDIGDMGVVLINIAKLAGTDLKTCLEHSYNEIKDRKGQWKNGVFVKETDLR